jgi:hypothetical protein
MSRHRGSVRIERQAARAHLRGGIGLLVALVSGAGLLPAVMGEAGTTPPSPQGIDRPAVPGRPVRAAGAAVVDVRRLVEEPQAVSGPTEVEIPFLPQLEGPSPVDITPPAGTEAR